MGLKLLSPPWDQVGCEIHREHLRDIQKMSWDVPGGGHIYRAPHAALSQGRAVSRDQ